MQSEVATALTVFYTAKILSETVLYTDTTWLGVLHIVSECCDMEQAAKSVSVPECGKGQ